MDIVILVFFENIYNLENRFEIFQVDITEFIQPEVVQGCCGLWEVVRLRNKEKYKIQQQKRLGIFHET